MNIGEISKLTGLPISTIRYYDKYGLLPNLNKENGVRKFNEKDISSLRMINCLKTSGMKISEIKQFINWCNEGKSSIDKRLSMFYEQEKNVKEQINVLTKSLKLIKFKQWYYEKAKKDGTEEIVKSLRIEEMPEDIAKLYKETH